jgi:DNA topoisomerase-1
VYEEGRDDEAAEKEQKLPPLAEGETLDLLKLLPEQHFTELPPRYTEPTLIKALEEHGIGRPSTYAATVGVIQEREYVVKQQGRLHPTPLGLVVCDALLHTFSDIMDLGYTAEMEQKLDQVAEGKLGYAPMLDTFYQGFAPQVERSKQAMPQAVEQALWAGLDPELRNQTCPQCGKPLAAKLSSAGRLLGCTGYPECRYLLDLSADGKPSAQTVEYAEGVLCDKCGGRMKILTRGRDKFMGCEHYPACKNTKPILSAHIVQLAAESACPTCGHKPLEARKSRFGEYLRCPACNANVAVKKPRKGEADQASETLQVRAPAQRETVDTPCPTCGKRPLEKRVGRFGPYYRCPACKTNYSAKKLASLTGQPPSGEGDPDAEVGTP